jgi:hypothetical protein
MPDYTLPWWTNAWRMLAILVAALIVFHFLFLRFCRLTKVGWKKVDYYWVSVAFLGIVSAVLQSRENVAKNHRELSLIRAEGAFGWFKDAIAFGNSPAICRKFVRSQFQPPEEELQRVQREYDAQCAWFKQLADTTSKMDGKSMEALDLAKLAPPHPTGGEPWAYERLSETIRDYLITTRAGNL